MAGSLFGHQRSLLSREIDASLDLDEESASSECGQRSSIKCNTGVDRRQASNVVEDISRELIFEHTSGDDTFEDEARKRTNVPSLSSAAKLVVGGVVDRRIAVNSVAQPDVVDRVCVGVLILVVLNSDSAADIDRVERGILGLLLGSIEIIRSPEGEDGGQSQAVVVVRVGNRQREGELSGDSLSVSAVSASEGNGVSSGVVSHGSGGLEGPQLLLSVRRSRGNGSKINVIGLSADGRRGQAKKICGQLELQNLNLRGLTGSQRPWCWWQESWRGYHRLG